MMLEKQNKISAGKTTAIAVAATAVVSLAYGLYAHSRRDAAPGGAQRCESETDADSSVIYCGRTKITASEAGLSAYVYRSPEACDGASGIITVFYDRNSNDIRQPDERLASVIASCQGGAVATLALATEDQCANGGFVVDSPQLGPVAVCDVVLGVEGLEAAIGDEKNLCCLPWCAILVDSHWDTR
jgi:hypothetical protein